MSFQRPRAATDEPTSDRSRETRSEDLTDVVAASGRLSPLALAQEFTGVAAKLAGASQTVLYLDEGEEVRCIGLAPSHIDSPLMVEVPSGEFPWGMSSLQPHRYVLVEEAGDLRLPRGTRVAELGLRSVVHIPLGPGSVGTLHIYWDRLVRTWDDDLGAQLRAIGGFVIGRLVDATPGRIIYGRRRTDP